MWLSSHNISGRGAGSYQFEDEIYADPGAFDDGLTSQYLRIGRDVLKSHWVCIFYKTTLF